MPVHDWSEAPDYLVHNFHLGWAVELLHHLNRGVLPHPIFAMTEPIELRPAAPLADLSEPDGPPGRRVWPEALPNTIDQPPRIQFRGCDDRPQYACRAISVRDENCHPLAVILWATREDSETPYRRDALVNFVVGALTRGTHVLLIDVFHPICGGAKRLHDLIWGRIDDGGLALPAGAPLTLSSYSTGATLTAYVEPLSAGDELPEMPLFLTEDRYVLCPLAATYHACWDEMPRQLRDLVITRRPGAS